MEIKHYICLARKIFTVVINFMKTKAHDKLPMTLHL